MAFQSSPACKFLRCEHHTWKRSLTVDTTPALSGILYLDDNGVKVLGKGSSKLIEVGDAAFKFIYPVRRIRNCNDLVGEIGSVVYHTSDRYAQHRHQDIHGTFASLRRHISALLGLT